MNKFIFILSLTFSFIVASCGGPVDDNSGDDSVDAVDSLVELGSNEDLDLENSELANLDKECGMESCEKYGCDKAEACTAECMANCENPEKCSKMMTSDSTDTACEGGE